MGNQDRRVTVDTDSSLPSTDTEVTGLTGRGCTACTVCVIGYQCSVVKST